MATRINKKFVVILACVLVVLTAGGAYMVLQLKKTAAEHVAIANKAWEEGEAALEEGDIETANNRFSRAASNFYFAKTKDGLNNEHLYRFVEVRQKLIVDDLTLAHNEIGTILQQGLVSIHNTPNASDEDRAYLYETLVDWHRMRPSLNTFSPIGQVNDYTEKRLTKAPNDPVASYYRTIGESYLAGITNEAEDRVEILEHITTQLDANPDDVALNLANARFHIGNARRQFRANGNAYTEAVALSYQQAEASLARTFELAGNDPVAMIDTLELTLSVLAKDREQAAKLAGRQVVVAEKMRTLLEDKANRDQLYTEELKRCVTYFRALNKGTKGNPFDGPGHAETLAKTIVADRPNEPTAHAILGSVYNAQRAFDKAEKQIEQGLAIDRLTNGMDFIRDQHARMDMLSELAEIKITLALTKAAEPEARDQLFLEATKLTDEYTNAETRDIESRDARADLLKGRLALSQGQPEKAVVYLDRASEAYGKTDVETLRYLAQAHRLLKNSSMVIDLYEQIVQLNPSTPLRLNLVNLYLAERQEDQLNRAEQHLKFFLRQYPSNLNAVRLMANLLTQRGDATAAIKLLQEQDTEAHPELLQDINRYQAAAGDPSGIIESLRKKIAEREPGKPVNLSLTAQLIELIPGKAEKLAEIQKLEANGLPTATAQIFRDMVETGRLTLENELLLLESRDLAPIDLAIRKIGLYARRGENQLARKALEEASQLDADNPLVIEWAYKLALIDGKWDLASKAIADMLALPAEDRGELAVANGVFMRARLIAAKAMSVDENQTREKMLRDAALSFTAALKEYPFKADGWLQLGKIQILQKNYFGAQKSLREALILQNNDVEVLENMAIAQLGAGDVGSAMDRYQQILKIKPNHRLALDQYAKLAAQIGQDKDSIAIREQVRASRPKDTENRRALALLYAKNKLLNKAKSEIAAVIQIEGKTLTNVGYQSQVLLLSGDNDEAIQAVTAYVNERGEDVTWRDYVVLAETYQRAGQNDQADAEYAKAVAKEGDESITAAQIWGKALLARGDNKRASVLFEQLAAKQPENNTLKTRAAELLIRNGEALKGEALAKQLPETPARYQLLIQSSIVRRQDPSQTIELTRDAVKAFPDNYVLQLQLGRQLLDRERKKDAAERDFEELHALAKQLNKQFPDQVDAKLLLADVLFARGRTQDTIKLLEEILAYAPSHIKANERLSNIWLAQAAQVRASDPRTSTDLAMRALELINRLIKSKPDQPQLYRAAGAAASLAGRKELAMQHQLSAFQAFGTERDLGNYATALLEAGRGAEARAVLENPDHATMVSSNLYLRALRGRALAMAGAKDQAAALFGNTLRTHADNPQSRSMLMQQAAAAFINEPDRLITIIDKQYGDTAPADIDAMISALLQNAKRFEDSAKRLAKYENNPASDPAMQLNMLLNLALARQKTEDYEGAKSTYQQALTMVEEQAGLVTPLQKIQLLNNLAYLLSEQVQGYEQQAVAYSREAVRLMPKNATPSSFARIQDTLGWSLFKAGQTDEAITVLERSVANAPMVANQIHLGRAYLSVGKQDKAVLIFESALKLAKAENDAEMITEAKAWFDKAIRQQP